MINDIKFAILPYKEGYYWSKTKHKMQWMNDIAPMVWETEDLPVKMKVMSIHDSIKFIAEHPGTDKKSRNALMRIISDRFALKDRVGIDKWNGIIYTDLDMIHSLMFCKLNAEKTKLLYEQLDYALQNICPNNYLYIEHSSSGIGIHCMFYFDCKKTQANYDKFCQYIYDVFRYKVDDYIKDFSSIFTDTDGNKVFDDVYKRPYQKLYITTKDYILHDCSGYCDDIEVNIVEKEIEKEINEEKTEISRGSFNVKYIRKKKKWDTDYYQRLYILTALKKYVGDKDKVRKLWYAFCEDISLYKNYTTQKFKNMLDLNWNKIKADTGHIGILKKYGFNIDESELHMFLNDDEYISDVVNDILKFCVNGLNILNSGTGTGKTEVWKKWWMDVINDIMKLGNHKPILIVEPMNSIINTKYDPEIFEIITGSKRITFDGNCKCYITNYNHLIKQTFDGSQPRDDIEEFFGQFEFVIIDESHIMLKDTFRSDILIPFLQTLNKITNTKVILQTATPFFEKSILNIKKQITIHKKEKSNTKIIYRQAPEKFNIAQIICLVNYYVTNHKKVYIYWSNGSLQNMKFIKEIYPEAIIIYHKRDAGSDEMVQIDNEHQIGNCDVMISSVYFGVGNDLNDEIEDAAVIIIGNNTWQEDIQAKGRWRNAKNVEVCIILRDYEMEFIDQTKESAFDWDKRYGQTKYSLETIYNDSLNRDKSIVVGGKSFMIKDKEYVHYLAAMKTANEYSSQFCVKNDEFKRLGYDVRETIKPLLINKDWEDELKAYRKNLKGIRNSQFVDFLKGEYNWDKINKDSSLERCARIIRKLQSKDLIKYCDVNKFIKSKILRYATFLRFYNKSILDMNDLAELFSMLWVRDNIKKSKGNRKVGEIEITNDEYFMLCGYLIWLSYRNKNDNTNYMNGNYFNEFCKKCRDIVGLEEPLINRIFVQNAYSDDYNRFIEDFLGEKLNNTIDVSKDNLIEYIVKLSLDDDYLQRATNYIVNYIKDKHTRGKTSSNKKKCTITEQFKHPKKYGLVVGQEFESASELVDYTKKNRKTIAEWRSKGWIS